jgi:hypothetical protein
LFDGVMHGGLVERHNASPPCRGVGAAVEHASARPHFVNDPTAGRREVWRGTCAQTRRESCRRAAKPSCVGVAQAALSRSNEQRGFGGVALHLETAVSSRRRVGIVAKHTGAQALGQRGMSRPSTVHAVERISPLARSRHR